jgi:hypothetical protein
MNVRISIRPFFWAAAVLIASQAASAWADDDSASVATACLRRSDIRTTRILSDRNVLFITRDKTTYNNQLARQCPGIRQNSVMSFTYGVDGKLCSGSTFTVLYRASPSTNTISYIDPVTNKPVTMQGPPFQQGPVCQIGMFSPISPDEVKALMAASQGPKPSRRRTDRDAVKTEAVEARPATQQPAGPPPARQ